MRRGDVEQALALMREGYACDPSPSHAMRLGVGYLWAKEYQAAWEHFQLAIQRHPNSIAAFFGMAGAAKWCMDEPDAAVMIWKSGLNAQYADGAGGVQLPLLLSVASILKPSVLSRSEAGQILAKKAQDSRMNNWPGPLAMFVLNSIDVRALEARSIQSGSREAPPHRKWLVSFYRGLLEFDRADLKLREFEELMRRMVDTSDPKWAEERSFLRLLWSEEFFIARHEASSTN